MTNGCSHALQMAIEVIANAGDNILIPAPGFSLYSTLTRSQGIEVSFNIKNYLFKKRSLEYSCDSFQCLLCTHVATCLGCSMQILFLFFYAKQGFPKTT